MSRVFFTSDTHFGHGNIIRYSDRPFLTPEGLRPSEAGGPDNVPREATERMDAVLIANINALVGPHDVLWHLGDWAFAGGRGGYYEVCRAYRDRIICRNMHLVWGNHDRRSIRDLFGEAHDQVEVSVEGQRIVLNHFAMAVWHKSHRDAWHLYGHSHANAEVWLDAHMPGRRSVDVGVDNAARLLGDYRPWSFEELRDWMATRPGCSIDHHGAEVE
jgi:calcineurin-like phosphoesterase family protein